ncbi:hypothetical protein [Abyssibius alkaniclasticus]|nr:hypothetical protein [Abyssibius alkaniclasticus]
MIAENLIGRLDLQVEQRVAENIPRCRLPADENAALSKEWPL